MATPSAQSAPTKNNGKRTPPQSRTPKTPAEGKAEVKQTPVRNAITTPVICLHNHIDLKTGEPAYGRWKLEVWQRILAGLTATKNHVTVTPVKESVANKKAAIVDYGRAVTLTGSKTGIEAMQREYDREQSAIYMAARNAFAAAAQAEVARAKAEADGNKAEMDRLTKEATRLNPEAQDWAPFKNSFAIGAVRAFAKEFGLAVEGIPAPRHAGIAAVGEGYKSGKIPTPKPVVVAKAEKPKAEKSAAPKPAAKPKPAPEPEPIVSVAEALTAPVQQRDGVEEPVQVATDTSRQGDGQ